MAWLSLAICHDRNIRQRTCNKQVDTDWRSNKSDCKVDNHDHTKLDRVHSDRCHDREQDRCQNQDCRCGIHDHSDDQQEQVDDQQDRNRAVEVVQDKFTDCLWHLHQSQDSGKCSGSCQNEEDRCESADRFHKNRPDIPDM